MADNGLDAPDKEGQDAFVLPEKFTIGVAAGTFQSLMIRVEQERDVLLDGGGVERIDAAGVQLLMVVQQALAEARHTLRWLSVSDALRESADLLGLAGQLSFPGAE